MHELAIAQGILRAVDETLTPEQAGRIRRIIVTVGELNIVQKECLEFAFTAITAGTPKESAELVLQFISPVFKCTACDAEFEPEDGFYSPCPGCGGFGVEVVKGDELYVKSVDLEEGEKDA